MRGQQLAQFAQLFEGLVQLRLVEGTGTIVQCGVEIALRLLDFLDGAQVIVAGARVGADRILGLLQRHRQVAGELGISLGAFVLDQLAAFHLEHGVTAGAFHPARTGFGLGQCRGKPADFLLPWS